MKFQKARAYRSAPRQEIEPLKVSSISLMENLTKVAREGVIREASITGFLVELTRENLVMRELRQNLNLDLLVGSTVLIYLPQMDMELSGKVARTKFLGKDEGYLIGIDYTDDAPEYWRECLMDLLPKPGEIDEL
jgi:hypothetical protein